MDECSESMDLDTPLWGALRSSKMPNTQLSSQAPEVWSAEFPGTAGAGQVKIDSRDGSGNRPVAGATVWQAIACRCLTINRTGMDS